MFDNNEIPSIGDKIHAGEPTIEKNFPFGDVKAERKIADDYLELLKNTSVLVLVGFFRMGKSQLLIQMGKKAEDHGYSIFAEDPLIDLLAYAFYSDSEFEDMLKRYEGMMLSEENSTIFFCDEYQVLYTRLQKKLIFHNFMEKMVQCGHKFVIAVNKLNADCEEFGDGVDSLGGKIIDIPLASDSEIKQFFQLWKFIPLPWIERFVAQSGGSLNLANRFTEMAVLLYQTRVEGQAFSAEKYDEIMAFLEETMREEDSAMLNTYRLLYQNKDIYVKYKHFFPRESATIFWKIMNDG